MKLEKVILENFRSYEERISVDINDLTSFIGKNDIGKSTILEALEIFFNNTVVKIEQEDLCVHSNNNFVRIGCVFSDLPKDIIIDSSAITTLEQEYLLNDDNQLEIHKLYDCSKKTINPEVFIIANYPSTELSTDLIQLNNTQLKKLVKELALDEKQIVMSSNVSIRQAIYRSLVNPEFSLKEISLAKGEGKPLWEKIKGQLPLYSLFQSDRPSLDGDSEVQDPMKLAVKEALETVQEQLDLIKENIEKKVLEVAGHTVEKLKEMDETLAKQLTPKFTEEPKWDKIFKLSLDGDENIPINKRGSGVRRLILLNFFRAEAERKMSKSNGRGVIYAIEEPETAQHPNNQMLLAEALKTLSETENTQVILTTHVPGFAGLLPIDSLRYIEKTALGKMIHNASNDMNVIKDVANALGVLRSPIEDNVKLLVFVEGIHDVETLKTFSEIISQVNEGIINLRETKKVVVLPLGGSTLKGWVEKHYLKSLGLPEVHIYDGDNMSPPKYQESCNMVNARGDGSKAFSTYKREMENYISHKAIKSVLDIDIAFTGQCNVPNLLAKKIHEDDVYSSPWDELKPEKVKQKESKIKKRLNNEVVQAMTYEQLCEVDIDKEVEHWLLTISNFCLESVVSN